MDSKFKFWTQITKSDQYRAINELIIESHPNGSYFTLLILSSIIIASGLLLADSAILIGGMLVTPLLTPILLMALGVVLSRSSLIRRTSVLLLKSIVVVFVVSFIAGLIFSTPDKDFFGASIFNNRAESVFLYFLVAFVSGIAATFAWVRKKINELLPGISIAVSLVPPIASVGIWLSHADVETARFFLIVFLFNLIGVVMGSIIVFSMLKFYTADDEVTANLNSLDRQKDNDSKKNENI